MKALRTIAGLLLVAFVLCAAAWAVRDCAAGLYTYDNCLWLSLRERLGLPENKLLRAAVLEFVGLTLLAGLYLTIRYVFPARAARSSPSEIQSNGATASRSASVSEPKPPHDP